MLTKYKLCSYSTLLTFCYNAYHILYEILVLHDMDFFMFYVMDFCVENMNICICHNICILDNLVSSLSTVALNSGD